MKTFSIAEMENLFYWLRTHDYKYEMHFIDSDTIAIRKNLDYSWEIKSLTELLAKMHECINKENIKNS